MNRIFYRFLNPKTFQYCLKLRADQNVMVCIEKNITFLNFRTYYQHCKRRAIDSCQNFSCNSHNKINIRNASRTSRPSVSSSTRVTEQVVLYSNENTKFLKVVNLFGFSFAAFWFFTSYQFATMHITPVIQRNASNLPWFARFDLVSSESRKVIATLLTAFLGSAVFGGAWMYSIRSVGKVMLGKAGKTATFVTYNPLTFSMNKTTTAEISEISCQGHRSINDVVPIKLRGKWMHYLLSKEGIYHNGPLFDRSVGLRRSI